MQAIIIASPLPLKESAKSLVSLESRNGICPPLFLESAKAVIHFPRVNSDLFMLNASANVSKVVLDSLTFSLPDYKILIRSVH